MSTINFNIRCIKSFVKHETTPSYHAYLSIYLMKQLILMQARAIILLANKEMEGTKPSLDSLLLPFLQSPLNSLSMKKSLQRYLQKRKTRIQATSPYHHHL